MKHILLSFAVPLAACIIFLAPASATPNIVVILNDDMGYADLPMFGDSEIPTPNLQRLADSGVKPTDAHVSAPVCVPSRMGLLTGRYQQRFGIYDNQYTPEENRLWVKERTLADELKAHDYRTANVGKWHLSGNNGDWPWKLPGPHERGFDEFVGIKAGMDDFWTGTELVRFHGDEYVPFGAPEYLTDFFGHGAVIWVFISEIFPNRVRARGQALGSFTHWGMNAIIAWTFPVIAGGFAIWLPFAFFALCMIGQLLWVILLMPETKGVPLEKIQKQLGID